MKQAASYVKPQVVTLTSEQILELLGPAQGYMHQRYDTPLSMMDSASGGKSVRRM